MGNWYKKQLFEKSYKIQSIAIANYPHIVNRTQIIDDNYKSRKQAVTIILSDGSSSNVVINLELLAFQAEELEKMHKEGRYLTLDFKKTEEDD